jgi:hypothetical protein
MEFRNLLRGQNKSGPGVEKRCIAAIHHMVRKLRQAHVEKNVGTTACHQ